MRRRELRARLTTRMLLLKDAEFTFGMRYRKRVLLIE